MFTVTYEQLIYGVGIVLLGYLIYDRILTIVKVVKRILKDREANNKYFENLKKVEKMKSKGEHHEWVDMGINHPTMGFVNTHVCKKTGYAPAIESFISMEYIERILNAKKDEEEFQEYKEEKLKEYALKYGIDEVQEVYEKMITIKKDYKIKKMENFKKEIKEKFGDNVKVISDISELEKILKQEK